MTTTTEWHACLKCGLLIHFYGCEPCPLDGTDIFPTPCPACGLPSLYVEAINRCVHTAGEPNEDCWLPCMQGRTDPVIHRRLDAHLARRSRTRRRHRGAA